MWNNGPLKDFFPTPLMAPKDAGAGGGLDYGATEGQTKEAVGETPEGDVGSVLDGKTGTETADATADTNASGDKPAGEKAEPADEKAKVETPDASDVVPEDGVYKFDMPEGVEVDKAMADALSPALKAANITQKQANVLTEAMAAHVMASEKARVDDFVSTVKGWIETAKADKDIGGSKWDTSVKVANTAISQFGDPELLTLLRDYGLGNHPAMIRFAKRIGDALADDKLITGEAETTAPAPIEEAWYGTTTKNQKG